MIRRRAATLSTLMIPLALLLATAGGCSTDDAAEGSQGASGGNSSAGASPGKSGAGGTSAGAGKSGATSAGAAGTSGTAAGASGASSGGTSAAAGAGGSGVAGSGGQAAGSSAAGSSAAGSSAGGSSAAGSSAAGSSAAGTSAAGSSAAGSSAAGSSAAGSSAAGSSAAGSGGAPIVWRKASLTNFESYPDPGSPECIEFNGCMWAGQFAGVDGKQTEAWVMAHNIAAVHSKDFNEFKLKTLRLRKDGKEIDVTVYDECADSDCSGCCTQNAKPSGYLIDIEKYTAQRFGVTDGQVEWRCLDCP